MHKKIKTTITLSSHIKEFATKEAHSLGLDFSAYITVLIAEKLRGCNVIPPSVSSINSDNGYSSELTIDSKDEIDEFQIDELDRLLSLTTTDE